MNNSVTSVTYWLARFGAKYLPTAALETGWLYIELLYGCTSIFIYPTLNQCMSIAK